MWSGPITSCWLLKCLQAWSWTQKLGLQAVALMEQPVLVRLLQRGQWVWLRDLNRSPAGFVLLCSITAGCRKDLYSLVTEGGWRCCFRMT